MRTDLDFCKGQYNPTLVQIDHLITKVCGVPAESLYSIKDLGDNKKILNIVCRLVFLNVKDTRVPICHILNS